MVWLRRFWYFRCHKFLLTLFTSRPDWLAAPSTLQTATPGIDSHLLMIHTDICCFPICSASNHPGQTTWIQRRSVLAQCPWFCWMVDSRSCRSYNTLLLLWRPRPRRLSDQAVSRHSGVMCGTDSTSHQGTNGWLHPYDMFVRFRMFRSVCRVGPRSHAASFVLRQLESPTRGLIFPR